MTKIKLINVVKFLIGFVFVILSIFFIFNWAYNLFALDDTKLYDANNKYIDPSLPDPNIESNLKPSYKLKQKSTNIFLKIMAFMEYFKKIFFVLFSGIVIYAIFIDKQTGIIPLMKDIMYKNRK